MSQNGKNNRDILNPRSKKNILRLNLENKSFF